MTPKHEEEKVLPPTQDEILAATIAEEKREVTELQSQLDRVQATLKQSQSEELAQLEEIRQAENSLRPARERFGQLTSSPWLNDLKASADGAAR
ncbi:MAG: hypothetical protein SFV23_01780 [Planctomycetaceae bacterium]|nr:hypothetical protein [Planctomycetaceae bacterium]